MRATAYHGTPITSLDDIVLKTLGARDYCVSYYTPQQVEWVDANARSWFGDCGTYAFWQEGIRTGHTPEEVFTRDYLDGYYGWSRRWCLEGSGRCKWVVIPDPIGVGTQLLDALINEWPEELRAFGVPVWHTDEPISRAIRLLETHGRLCVGAVGEEAVIGSWAFCFKLDELFDEIVGHFGRVMPVHMFRSLSLLGPEWPWPFHTHDSTALARNLWRAKKFGAKRLEIVRRQADRWDRLAANRPDEWVKPPRPQFLFRHS